MYAMSEIGFNICTLAGKGSAAGFFPDSERVMLQRSIVFHSPYRNAAFPLEIAREQLGDRLAETYGWSYQTFELKTRP